MPNDEAKRENKTIVNNPFGDLQNSKQLMSIDQHMRREFEQDFQVIDLLPETNFADN
jgi:hypothetical protein